MTFHQSHIICRPYDDSCFVCEIKPKYCLLLNKFNVLENHLLLITKPFEPQTDHLNLQDFTAIFDLLKQLETKDQDWVVFYNRGVYSGASQPHKHFQIIGGKDAQGNYIFPILNKLAKHARDGKETVTEYPFLHSFSPLKNTDPKAVFSTYESLLKRVNVYNSKPSVDEKEEKMIIICEGPGLKETEKYEFSLSPSKYPSYNLLFTKSWMLVIPRRAENYNKISVNSLGFLFSLFAKTQEDLQKIRDVGAMKLLREVTFPQNK